MKHLIKVYKNDLCQINKYYRHWGFHCINVTMNAARSYENKFIDELAVILKNKLERLPRYQGHVSSERVEAPLKYRRRFVIPPQGSKAIRLHVVLPGNSLKVFLSEAKGSQKKKKLQ